MYRFTRFLFGAGFGFCTAGDGSSACSGVGLAERNWLGGSGYSPSYFWDSVSYPMRAPRIGDENLQENQQDFGIQTSTGLGMIFPGIAGPGMTRRYESGLEVPGLIGL